jgi:uncharacterized protein YozE (UPF0346 family)
MTRGDVTPTTWPFPQRPRSFRQWLLAQRKRNDPVGDLARDFLGDDEAGRTTDTELFAYLRKRLPEKELVDEAWLEYLGAR